MDRDGRVRQRQHGEPGHQHRRPHRAGHRDAARPEHDRVPGLAELRDGDNIVEVVARDACGNESRCSFHVHVLDNPVGEIAGPAAVCPGGSATLVGPAGFNYLWSTGETSQSIVVSAAGTYTLRITDK